MVTGFLKDVSLDTFVTELPSIIGFNNRAVEKEFGYIFDPSANALVQSVHAPSGKVEAHWGKFKNLETDYITVRDSSSFQKFVSGISHNDFGERYVDASIDVASQAKFAHDSSSIYVTRTQSLYQMLLSIEERLSALEKKLS